jgi:hypothetical protein
MARFEFEFGMFLFLFFLPLVHSEDRVCLSRACRRQVRHGVQRRGPWHE